MKLQLFFAAIGLIVSTNVQAQAGFKADVGQLFDRGEVSDFTDKYNGYQSAQIFFNSLLMKLVVFKKSADCIQSEACSLMAPAPLEVYFQVKRVERFGCYDSYHAKTPDAVKSEILEQIIIHRFASERCQTLQEIEGTVHYKVSGLNSETGEAGSAAVFAKLLNVNFFRIDNQ